MPDYKELKEEAREVITKTYMRRGGLTDWEREYVEKDTDAILRALERKGLYFADHK